MNSIIETLNVWGEQALSFAWPMLWQSSVLIGVIFALDFALRRKVRAAVRYALWLVVLVKLLLPPSLALPTGIGWWLRPATVTPTKTPTKSETAPFVVSDTPEIAPSLPVPEPPSLALPPRAPMSAPAWALLAWFTASIGLLVWLVVRWWQVARDVRRAGPAPESVSESLGEARRLAGLRRTVRLRLTERAMSPAVCGLFRPVIVLPRALTEHLAPAQLRAVLLHELTHLRRGDVWVNCAQALLQIAYWWHPLLWLANARIRRVREEAVDDAVMLALREDADTYAPTLLEVAKLAFNRPLASLGLVGILESRSALRQRIERLVDFRMPRKAGLTLVSVLGILAFTALAVPMENAPGESNILPGVVSGGRAQATPYAFEGRLRIINKMPNGAKGSTFEHQFQVELAGGRWLVRLDKLATDAQGKTNAWRDQVGGDGRDIYRTVEFPTNSSQLGTNLLFGYAEEGWFPQKGDLSDRLLWLAFCSADYLSTVESIPSMRDPRSVDFQPLNFDAEYFQDKGLPRTFAQRSPGYSIMRQGETITKRPLPAPFNEGWTDFQYRALEYTNVAGTVFPLSFSAEVFLPMKSTNGAKSTCCFSSTTGWVSRISIPSKAPEYPALSQNANIYDYRFTNQANRPLMYHEQKGGQWLSRADSNLEETISSKPPILPTKKKSAGVVDEKVSPRQGASTAPPSSLPSQAPEEPSTTLSSGGRTNVFDFKNLEVRFVLDVYKQLTGLALVANSGLIAVRSAPIAFQTDHPVSKTEAAQLIEQALLEQAGVVITRLDDKRASVTWNGTQPANQPSGREAGGTRQKLVLTPNDVDPQSVRTFDWDTTSVSVKPLGKSSEEIQLMKNRPTDIVSGERIVARSPGSAILKRHGTNDALLLMFRTTAEGTAAAAALRGQDFK